MKKPLKISKSIHLAWDASMLSGNSKQVHNIKFDEQLSDWKEVFAKRKDIITVFDPVEEEKECGREVEECETQLNKIRRTIMLS